MNIIIDCGQKPSWHDVVQVNVFNKRLDVSSFIELFLAHFSGNFSSISVNSSD